jgi:hypothetical protein
MAIPEVDESLYNNDEVMAGLGRQLIDQYVGWCRKFGEPENLRGWASYVQQRLLSYMENEEVSEDGV